MRRGRRDAIGGIWKANLRESLGKHEDVRCLRKRGGLKKRVGYIMEANFSYLMILPKAVSNLRSETAEGDKELQSDDLG